MILSVMLLKECVYEPTTCCAVGGRQPTMIGVETAISSNDIMILFRIRAQAAERSLYIYKSKPMRIWTFSRVAEKSVEGFHGAIGHPAGMVFKRLFWRSRSGR
jgi:hypothetical protein